MLVFSEPNILTYKMKSPPRPNTPRPTTLRPMTEPPPKAIFSALASPVRAAFVVRLLALVATFIPIYPARPEANAPIINDNEIIALESLLPSFT